MIYNPRRIQTLKKSIEFSKNYIKSQEEKALQIGKTVVLEEFGISLDANSHDPKASTVVRINFLLLYSDM
jgi:endo-1,4-beta-mannosidase